MVSTEDKWIRIFDVPDISRHKKGFTIYKVISMLYPESCPDAITKITVWKRYNDFKKLHREMKSMHHSLNIKDKYPSLPSATFFKRFDEEIIQQRRQMILNFLEYISIHSQLFTSNSFVKFFETSHTPCAMLNSCINSIRAELNLPSEPEYLSFHSPESDDEHTMSDTDSVSTMGSLSSFVHINDHLTDSITKSSSSLLGLSKRLTGELSLNPPLTPKINRNNSVESYSNGYLRELRKSVSCENTTQVPENDCVSISQVNLSLDDVQSDLLRAQGKTMDQYVEEAEKVIAFAFRYEEDKKYQEAFNTFKQGISILLENAKGDKNIDRRQSVKYKIEKYLLRAEKIYNLHLSSDSKALQHTLKIESALPQRPLSDLYKFKVLKIIDMGMLVLHSESQQLYYVKVIQKTCLFNNDDLILPTEVPFMVRLYNFYNCENALFLVLEYCSGLKLWDYINQKSSNSHSSLKISQNPHETSDNESECSFSELLNEYNSNKSVLKEHPPPQTDPNMNRLNVDEMLEKSQELLSSVNETLRRNLEMKTMDVVTADSEEDYEIINIPASRKMSDVAEEFDLEQINSIQMEKVVKWAAQLLLALEVLHDSGVICSDLQTKNILINEKDDLTLTYICKISSRRVYNYKSLVTLAPEVYRFESLMPAADWWSYGTILYEMLVGMPLSFTHPEGILSYTMLKIPKFVSAEGRSLLKQLLTYEPHERLGSGINGTEEIKSHPFFSSIKWHSMKLSS